MNRTLLDCGAIVVYHLEGHPARVQETAGPRTGLPCPGLLQRHGQDEDMGKKFGGES